MAGMTLRAHRQEYRSGPLNVPFSITVAPPTGSLDGDVLIASVQFSGVSGAPTVATPAGWTFLSTENSNTRSQGWLFWRFRSGSASHTFDVSGTFSMSAATVWMTAWEPGTTSGITGAQPTAWRPTEPALAPDPAPTATATVVTFAIQGASWGPTLSDVNGFSQSVSPGTSGLYSAVAYKSVPAGAVSMPTWGGGYTLGKAVMSVAFLFVIDFTHTGVMS